MQRRDFLTTVGRGALGVLGLGLGESCGAHKTTDQQNKTSADTVTAFNQAQEQTNVLPNIPYDPEMDANYRQYFVFNDKATSFQQYAQLVLQEVKKHSPLLSKLVKKDVSLYPELGRQLLELSPVSGSASVLVKPYTADLGGDFAKFLGFEKTTHSAFKTKDGRFYDIILIDPVAIYKAGFSDPARAYEAVLYQECFHALTSMRDQYEEARSQYVSMKNYPNPGEFIKNVSKDQLIPYLLPDLVDSQESISVAYQEYYKILKSIVVTQIGLETLKERAGKMKKSTNGWWLHELILDQEYQQIAQEYMQLFQKK